MRATPWLSPQGPPLAPYQRGVATYPQVYYWGVHALAEPVIRGAGLNPWDATFVYRLATCAMAAGLWALVWVACRRAAIPPDVAGTLVAFVVLTPMFAFISSATNPDAVNDALAAIVVITAWEVLTLGTGGLACAVALLGAALTKPAGLQLAAVLALVAVGLGALRLVDRRRAATVAGIAVGVTAIAIAVFYAWQPLRFLATGPSNDTLAMYVAKRWELREEMLRTYWGQLGWLDYSAPIRVVLPAAGAGRRQPRLPDLAAAPSGDADLVSRHRVDPVRRLDVRRRAALPARGRLHVPGPLPAAGRPRPGRGAAARGARRPRRLPRGPAGAEPGAGA